MKLRGENTGYLIAYFMITIGIGGPSLILSYVIMNYVHDHWLH